MNFTAARIAEALGKTPRGIRKALAGIDPAGTVIVNGKPTAAWSLDELPARLREALAAAAEARGCDSVERLLNHAPKRWEPMIGGRKVSLSDLAPHCLDDARKLQRALAGVLPLAVDARLPKEEIEAAGLRDYKVEIGHDVTAGHWWRLVERTIDRDAGAGDFSRLELYLSDKLARKDATPAGYSAAAEGLHTLKRWVMAVADPARPTKEETLMVWHGAFLEFELLTGEFMIAEGKARKSVLKALGNCGVHLAKSRESLRRAFYRKLKLWVENGRTPSAIEDKRAEKSGHRRAPALPEEDRLTILARCVENGGRISQGWREVMRRGELSFETTQRFIHNPASKSHVPHAIREAVGNDVELLANIHHGPHQHKVKGAYVTRDYSDMQAGDWFSADDVTQNHYFWIDTPEGRKATRGQTLLFIDVRTGYILGYALHPEKTYNSRVIREQITQLHDSWGFPRKGLLFEQSIWKAKLLVGDPRGDELPFEDTEKGLSEYVRFIHARNPRAKTVERIIGIIQNEMESLPGYGGRAEMIDKYERLQKNLRHARSGKIAYEDFLLSMEELEVRLKEIVERYNHTPQEGHMLKGLSPHEAFEEFFNWNDPLIRLPKENRFLLSNHRKPMKVTRNGIRLTFKGESWWYRNADTSHLQGHQVLVWYETTQAVPDFVTITDMDQRNPVLIPREVKPAELDADPEELSRAMRQSAEHNSYARTIYRKIEPKFSGNLFRQVISDKSTRDLGEKIETQRKAHATKKRKDSAVTRKIRQFERERGLKAPMSTRDPNATLRGLELLKEADEMERREQEGIRR